MQKTVWFVNKKIFCSDHCKISFGSHAHPQHCLILEKHAEGEDGEEGEAHTDGAPLENDSSSPTTPEAPSQPAAAQRQSENTEAANVSVSENTKKEEGGSSAGKTAAAAAEGEKKENETGCDDKVKDEKAEPAKSATKDAGPSPKTSAVKVASKALGTTGVVA